MSCGSGCLLPFINGHVSRKSWTPLYIASLAAMEPFLLQQTRSVQLPGSTYVYPRTAGTTNSPTAARSPRATAAAIRTYVCTSPNTHRDRESVCCLISILAVTQLENATMIVLLSMQEIFSHCKADAYLLKLTISQPIQQRKRIRF